MASFQVQIRDGAYNKVSSDKADYVLTDLDLVKTYYPRIDLEDLSKLRIVLVAMGIQSDRDRTLRNTSPISLIVPVQIAIQQKVSPSDTTYIDKLVELSEQVQASLEDDELVTGEKFSWSSTAPLKDENDLIFSYEQLTTEGVFQSIFTATYNYIKQ